MKLRRNQLCPIHDLVSVVGASKFGKNLQDEWVFNGLKTRIARGDIENSGHQRKCGNYWIAKLSRRTGYVRFAPRNLLTTTTLCQITKSPRGWEEHGEMIIRTISKQRIGGATEKKDQAE